MDNLIANPINSLNSLNPLNSLNTLSTLNPLNSLNLNTTLLNKQNTVKAPATVTKTTSNTVSSLPGDTVSEVNKTVVESTKADTSSLDALTKELNKKVEVNKKTIESKKEEGKLWKPWVIFILLFILFALILGFSKPNIVMTENDQRVVVLDWLKLIVWSLIFASIIMIIVVLIMKGVSNSKSKK